MVSRAFEAGFNPEKSDQSFQPGVLTWISFGYITFDAILRDNLKAFDDFKNKQKSV